MKKSILQFFFHVYLDRDNESLLKNVRIGNIFELITEDIKLIGENFQRVLPEAKFETQRGVVTQRSNMIDYFINAILLVLEVCLFHDLYNGKLNKTRFFFTIYESINKIKLFLSVRHNRLYVDYVQSLLIMNSEVNWTWMSYQLTAGERHKFQNVKPRSKRKKMTMFKNPTINPRVTIKTKLVRDNFERKLAMIKMNPEFGKMIKSEFNELVTNINSVEQKSREAFGGKCTIYFDELVEGLIKVLLNEETEISLFLKERLIVVLCELV